MAEPETCFHWAPDARLVAGRQDVPRPLHAAPASFAAIAPQPVMDACAALGAALITRTPFCIGAAAPPATLPAGRFLTLTGGTSGPPKVLQRSQASWIASFRVNARQFAYTTEDSIAVLGSLAHSLALYGTIEALHLGIDAFVLADISPTQQARLLRAKAITILYATPTQLRLLLASKQALPDLRLILCGGGMLDTDTRTQVAALCPNADLRVFYGAAETSFITLTDDATPEGSVGRAYPGVDLRTDPDGMIWVKSPYLYDADENPTSAPTCWKDGYLSVGEIGRLDKNGFLFLRGRAGRMVTVADKNIFLEEVEAVINALPGQPMTAVLAVPDPLRGSALVAVLEGPQSADVRAKFRNTCRKRLAPEAVPKKVIFVDEFPQLPSGKPDLRQLQHLLGGPE